MLLAMGGFKVDGWVLFLYHWGGMGLRWLSRFKLIRLRRISLATLPYGWRDGRRDGYKYILLPASGRWSHSLPR